MTTLATPVISIGFDEHPGEWRNFFHSNTVDALVETIVNEPPVNAPAYVRGHREIHLGETPYDPLHPEIAPMMLVAVGGGCGAVYFRDIDANGHALGFVGRAGDHIATPPRLAFNAQGSIDFDPQDVMTRDRLRRVIRAYLLDGQRPSVVAWRESEWVL